MGMNELEEHKLLAKLKYGDEQAFEKLFRQYYAPLCLYASGILQNNTAAEEVVQQFFVRFWVRRETLSINTSLKSYFFRSVKNRCLNTIKHEKIKQQHIKRVLAEAGNEEYSSYFLEVDLKDNIEKSIAALPEKRREIFRLSREEGLKYREIAEKLGISIKTVETQMGLAIKTLRSKLKKYKVLLLFVLGRISPND